MKVLIWLFFATLPFYYTSDFRLYLGGLSVTLNMLIAPVIMLFMVIKGVKFTKIKRSHFALFVLFLIFITLHLMSYNSGIEADIYIKHVAKITFAFIFFFISYSIASTIIKTEEALANYLKIFVYSSTVLLVIYIYTYAFVLHASFLGVLIDNADLTTKGKNQAQAYLVLAIPFVFYLLIRKFNLLIFGAFIIHLFSMIYLGSRALWLSLALTILIYALYHIKKIISLHSRQTIKISFYFIILWLFITNLFNIDFDLFAEALDSYNKLMSLYSGDYTNDSSATYRDRFIDIGFEYFSQSPLVGNGLGYFFTTNPDGLLTHNDYLFFISDLGALGLISFLAFSFYALYLLKDEHLIFLMIPFLIDLFFINAYNSSLFYILLGLFIGIDSKKKILI